MHFSGKKEITSDFAVTESHGSTIENTVSIYVDKLLLNHKTSGFYIVIQQHIKIIVSPPFTGILLYIHIQENNFQVTW